MASDTTDLFSNEIEQSADYFEPAIYQLLSFYYALELQYDPMSVEYTPVAPSSSSSGKAKLFAIGLLPPSVRPSGDLLDRTASIDSLTDDEAEVIPDNSSSSTGDLPGQEGGVPTGYAPQAADDSNQVIPDPVDRVPMSNDFWVAYVLMCNRLGCDPYDLARVIQSESSWLPNSQAKGKGGKVVAKGLIQFVRSTATDRRIGMSDSYYNNFQNVPAIDQLPWIEKYYGNKARGRTSAQIKASTLGGYNNQDGSLYNQNAAALGYRSAAKQANAYELNKGLDKTPDPPAAPNVPKGYISMRDLELALERHAPTGDVLNGISKALDTLSQQSSRTEEALPQDAQPNTQWVTTGADNANAAAQAIDQISNKSLNAENLGKRFADAQAKQIKAIQDKFDVIANTPPLRLLVNPTSFRFSAEKIVSGGSWGRNGPIVEHWGDQQEKLDISGKASSFFSINNLTGNSPGLTRIARQFSESYQNILSLWLLYKNNGALWLDDPTVPATTRANNLVMLGSVYIYFDEVLYVGSFDNMSLTESADTPFTLEFSLTFTVRAWFTLDHLSDDQYTYGQPASSQNPQLIRTTANSLRRGILDNTNAQGAVAPAPAASEIDEFLR